VEDSVFMRVGVGREVQPCREQRCSAGVSYNR
jgi:hypothetical protein